MLELVLHIDHGTVEKLLKDQIWSLGNHNPITKIHSQWLFALLSRLEMPITGDVASDLTHLTRLARKQRARITEEYYYARQDELAFLNMLILICEDCFRQIP